MYEKSFGYLIAFAIGVLFMILLSIAEGGLTPKWVPTAMDVYQGKTTLKITYENGVATDSVVVYKKK